MTDPTQSDWTLEEHIRALRGFLERLKSGEEPLPRSGAFVALDHLAAIEKITSDEEQST